MEYYLKENKQSEVIIIEAIAQYLQIKVQFVLKNYFIDYTSWMFIELYKLIYTWSI